MHLDIGMSMSIWKQFYMEEDNNFEVIQYQCSYEVIIFCITICYIQMIPNLHYYDIVEGK